MSIQVKNVSKRFGKFTALENVSLEVPEGQLLALLGPSGSGKTTLLRAIAGFETPDEGSVYFDGSDITFQRVRERKVGFVFQHYALFRHMTVFENIAFGLSVMPRRYRPSKAEIRLRVYELLRLVQLESFANRRPHELSGGQRQRVALARALAVQPKILLLDEPFGALDAQVRQELRAWLRRLHNDLHVTSVFVTHDQEEALEVADKVVVMNQGRIEQIGTPQEVYENPATPFVYSFLGNVNLFRGRSQDGRIDLGNYAIDSKEHGVADDTSIVGFVRSHELEIERSKNGAPNMQATVRQIIPSGPIVRVKLQRTDDGNYVEAQLARNVFEELALRVGEEVYVRPKNVRIFQDDYVI